MDKHYLLPLFSPQSIVVFAGSSDPGIAAGTPHARALRQALAAQPFDGKIAFVDDHTSGTLADLAHSRADLALIALPAAEVPAALETAARISCRAALVVGSGIGPEPAAECKRIARREAMLLLGPNSLGLQRPHLHLNASAAGPLARSGPLALVSQSSTLTVAMLDWAANNAVGFSAVVSLGPNTDVDVAQVLDFLASDGRTQGVIVYLEGISNARRFMSALRSAASAKPVVVLKAGRRAAGNAAAQTHCGAIVGSDEVFDAALRRAGAVRVRSFVELFSAAKVLAARTRPTGPRLAIVGNGGGPGVLAADWANEIHLQLGRLSDEAAAALKPRLPPGASLVGLVDLSEAAGPEHYRIALEALGADSGVDGVLAIHAPRVGTDAAAVASAVADLGPRLGKPLLACWMGDVSVGPARALLEAAGIPSFRTPESAVGAFGSINTFHHNQQLLMQTPQPLSALEPPDIDGARLVIESVLAERRTLLTELESKTLLSAFHIPVTPTLLARSAHEAMMIATQIGFPVALKIGSPDIRHKTDVQGVVLGIASAAAARDAYDAIVERVRELQPGAQIDGVTVQRMSGERHGREIYIGVVTDEPFGPVIVFGAGGTMIELIGDRAMELPPLNRFLARQLIDRSRAATMLGAWRGAPPVDIGALEQVLLRVSEMVCELPQLREMDINPIIAGASGAVAVDARIVVRHSAAAAHPYTHLAILPYPARHEQAWPMRGGAQYTVRAIHPGDAAMLQNLVQRLSPRSRYFRFVSAMTELPPPMLARFTLIDYDREMALVAVTRDRGGGGDGAADERIVGVSRYVINPDGTSCEFALLVDDSLNHRGVGSRLMESLMDVAREKGLAEIVGLVLFDNLPMLALMRHLGFTLRHFADDPSFVRVSHVL